MSISKLLTMQTIEKYFPQYSGGREDTNMVITQLFKKVNDVGGGYTAIEQNGNWDLINGDAHDWNGDGVLDTIVFALKNPIMPTNTYAKSLSKKYQQPVTKVLLRILPGDEEGDPPRVSVSSLADYVKNDQGHNVQHTAFSFFYDSQESLQRSIDVTQTLKEDGHENMIPFVEEDDGCWMSYHDVTLPDGDKIKIQEYSTDVNLCGS